MCGSRRPKFQPVEAPPEAPPEMTDPEVQEAIEREQELARRRRGRRATILTGPQGIQEPDRRQKTLLGQ